MSAPPVLRAEADPALAAVVVARMPLHYEKGADAAIDRPAHVRAGSSLAWVPGGIALLQDDTNFVAVVEPTSARVHAIDLPAGADGRRQFDDMRGNKRHKLDLEACVALQSGGDTLLLALGSGSSPRREYVVRIGGWEREKPSVTVTHVPRLYDALRREESFAGSELNVEGAIHLGDTLRLFGRGNGAPRDGAGPVNATCDLHWASLLAHLEDPGSAPPPRPIDVRRYELGELGGIPLGFTDAAVWGDAVLFSAAAEDSPDATRDGRVAGSAVGVIGARGRARWTPLTDTRGSPFVAKVEGLLPARGHRDQLYVVVDADDPGAASELCTVELRGSWQC